MTTATKTLKLPFLRLNRAKAEEFVRLQTLNTQVANSIVAMPKAQRRDLTSKSFSHVEIGSAWINQTIRTANAKTKVKQFGRLPLETNNQNWTLHKVGGTFSVAFGLRRGIKKRVPLAVHHAAHAVWLNAVLGFLFFANSVLKEACRERTVSRMMFHGRILDDVSRCDVWCYVSYSETFSGPFICRNAP